MVVMERREDGSVLVYRVLPCLPSAQAAAAALERIEPAAFAETLPQADTRAAPRPN